MSPPPTSTPPRDRRARLEAVGTLNGIDFVEIANDAETLLRIQFLTTTPDATALAAAITGATVTGGQSIATVEVQPPSSWSWSTAPSGRPVVDMSVAAPGDFSTYTLTLLTNAEVLDRYYDHVAFSFKAGCVSTTDCEPKPPPPGQVEGGAPPIDYLAKDFDSFRRALSEFSTRRYPAWQERSEADFGVMFMEALASLADDLSYQQDRIAAEAWLDTATERRSLVQLARLVDYEPAVAAVASTMLQFQMATPGTIPAGVLVSAYAPDGSFVEFETGTGLADQQSYDVHPAWNDLACHWFDDEQRCVPKGATSLYVIRPGAPLRTGQALLVEEAPLTPADPPRRTIVRLSEDAVDDIDPLFGSGPGPTPLARLTWRAEDALPFGVDLARTTLRGNLVPATDGRRHSERFTTTTAWSRLASRTRATVRTGPNGSLQFLYTLGHAPLAWLPPPEPHRPAPPELVVSEAATGPWKFQPSWLSARPTDHSFSLEPARYTVIDADVGAADYDGADGTTLRFGDGERGAVPADGARFEVTYRVGGGRRGNVAADALTRIDPATRAALGILSVSNPLAATGGRDEEPADQVRELAPHAFRARQYRAVRPSDYEEAVVRDLDWAQRAGTRFRWTGSWPTVFTAIDPHDTETLPPDRGTEATELLNRYRLAGHESFVLAPRFASLDVSISVCVLPDAFRGDVEEGVLDALAEFFRPDHFTFGVPLERSALEAAVQDVLGVDGVIDIRYRRRGHTAGYVTMRDTVDVAVDEIIRADNDPNRPEAGSFHVDVRGGK